MSWPRLPKPYWHDPTPEETLGAVGRQIVTHKSSYLLRPEFGVQWEPEDPSERDFLSELNPVASRKSFYGKSEELLQRFVDRLREDEQNAQ
ncbi:MAG: hypothetical protein ABIH23_05905 [bacterium]